MKEPIDYIISYIDFSKKEIMDLYKEVTGEEFDSDVNSTYLDFTLTLRLILKNMPFINKLYITCKDVQEFPKDTDELIRQSNGRIVRVNESEFLPDGVTTFSNCFIELFFWKIKGLSEHFIYGCDDMLPLNELSEDCFFRGGKPIMQYDWRKVNLCNLYTQIILNATNLIYDRKKNDDDDYSVGCFTQHTLMSLNKSICEECYNKYERFIKGPFHTVRYFNNFNIDLYLMYGERNGLIINEHHPFTHRYLPISEHNAIDLLKGRVTDDVVCVNDDHTVSEREKQRASAIMQEFMIRKCED